MDNLSTLFKFNLRFEKKKKRNLSLTKDEAGFLLYL